MDINRIKLSIVSLFMITICSWLLPLSIHSASRGISVISGLSHQSGKLGAYKALIIGINDYRDPKIPDLETAVNDARAMAKLLQERYDFQVSLLLDHKATRKAIYQALRNLASSSKPDDNVLIYYAGHGDLDRLTNDGWWIPANAKGGDPVTYLNNFLVQTYIRSMKARHVLLVSDSCYSGTLFGQARAMPQVIDDKYYLSLYNEKSRWGMTSGNKTPVSDRGSGGHSVFAYQLLKELRKNEKPYVSTQEIYTRIAPIVGNNSEQTPICRPIRNTGDQGGEFVFVASSGATIKAPVYGDKIDTGLDDERKQLELERKELELLKAKIEERKKITAERKRIEVEKKKLLTPKTSFQSSETNINEVPKLAHIPKKFEKTSKKSSIVITSNVIYSDIYLAKVDNKVRLSGNPKWTIKKTIPFTEDGLEPGLYYLKQCWSGDYGDFCSKVDTVELKEGMLTRLKGYIDQSKRPTEAKGPTWTSKFEKKE